MKYKYTFNGPADMEKFTTVTAPDEATARRLAMRERWCDRTASSRIPADLGLGLYLVRIEEEDR